MPAWGWAAAEGSSSRTQRRGARSRFILKVFSLESMILGLTSSILGLIISQTGSYLVSRTFFDISYKPFIGQSLLMVAGTTLLVVAVGLVSSISVLTRKPAVFLREQADE